MRPSALLRDQIEARIPSAFAAYKSPQYKFISTGLAQIDQITGGIPLNALTELCGSQMSSSGKTSVLLSLFAQATRREVFCALVDASDSFDPLSAKAAGIDFAKFLWVRCGKTRQKLPPLEQAFKASDILVQSGGFGVIAVDLSGIPEKVTRKIPLTYWFRLSRNVEKHSCALVFIEQQAHAAGCAALTLNFRTRPAVCLCSLFTQMNVEAEVVRVPGRKPVHSVRPSFPLKAQWA
jgi:recombination protein RecA